MMESLTVRQAAEQWGLSPRTVQQLCIQGRIPGAQKFGKAWAIPADSDKPEDLRRILDVTYRFSWGWRRIHNPDTGHDVADNLTTTEFSVAMLTAQGWTGREIAAHMNVSPNTAKRHLADIKKKLGISSRKEFKQYMLQ